MKSLFMPIALNKTKKEILKKNFNSIPIQEWEVVQKTNKQKQLVLV